MVVQVAEVVVLVRFRAVDDRRPDAVVLHVVLCESLLTDHDRMELDGHPPPVIEEDLDPRVSEDRLAIRAHLESTVGERVTDQSARDLPRRDTLEAAQSHERPRHSHAVSARSAQHRGRAVQHAVRLVLGLAETPVPYECVVDGARPDGRRLVDADHALPELDHLRQPGELGPDVQVAGALGVRQDAAVAAGALFADAQLAGVAELQGLGASGHLTLEAVHETEMRHEAGTHRPGRAAGERDVYLMSGFVNRERQEELESLARGQGPVIGWGLREDPVVISDAVLLPGAATAHVAVLAGKEAPTLVFRGPVVGLEEGRLFVVQPVPGVQMVEVDALALAPMGKPAPQPFLQQAADVLSRQLRRRRAVQVMDEFLGSHRVGRVNPVGLLPR